jgi:hypothetical protein
MPTTRRAVLCLLLLPIIFFMATKTRSQNRSAAVKQEKAAPQPKPASGLRPLAPAAREWVDSTLRRMTADEKIGQLHDLSRHLYFNRFARLRAGFA